MYSLGSNSIVEQLESWQTTGNAGHAWPYRVRNLSGRLLQYFGAATVKAASAYIDETNGTESFISLYLRLGRVVALIMSHFDRHDGTPIYIMCNVKK